LRADDDAVGDGEHLGQTVRDRRTTRRAAERAHAVEQALRLVVGQRRRGLVEDHSARPSTARWRS
jgi:hypothetical protein